jgi:DNA-directed RNA polymerase specialized sigma24 family protein
MTPHSAAPFPTTRWSVVRAAQDPDNPECVAAMNRCIAAYWKPIFCFLRAKGYTLHRAEDLTQEFFLQFYRRGWLDRADQQRGRFRTFLLTILVRFLSDQGAERAPQQKVFDERLVTISALLGDSERTYEPPDNRTPEEIFMQQWAQAVIANVQKSLEAWCNGRGRPDWHRMFSETYFPEPGKSRITQQNLADRLHLTRDQIRYGLEEVNHQFIELLRAEVADQIGPDGDLDAEIRELESLLRR